MTTIPFNLAEVHSSWRPCLDKALANLNADYLRELAHSHDWLPGPDRIFNAFSLPLDQVNYVLFGESPYPRRESANGYAFWDAAVHELWSSTGLSKQVNRATSLRNLIKMLLVAESVLDQAYCNQAEIARINKQDYVQTGAALFENLLRHGFLLLNTTLVLQSGPPHKDAKAWQPFMRELLHCLQQARPQATYILFGRVANSIDDLMVSAQVKKLYAEHPYNLSFISNPDVLTFFKPLHLLVRS